MQELNKLKYLVLRNIKLYFKDKFTFFISLATPLILVVLFLTFLRSVYEDSIISALPQGVTLDRRIINAFTGGWLFSSILSVSCITVAFCSNMMVVDKLNKTRDDFIVSPIKKATLLSSYTISNFITTFLIGIIVFLVSLVYLAIVGFYLSFVDILLILANLVIMIAFGSILSSIIGLFINSQGAFSAVSSLVSSMYGFICGAYMPIASFGKGMKYFVCFLPGTYGTILFRQSYMRGALNEISKKVSPEVAEVIRGSFDGKLEVFGNVIPSWAMFLIVGGCTLALFALYLLLSHIKKKSVIKSKKAWNFLMFC